MTAYNELINKLREKGITPQNEQFKKFGLSFNPFPQSGISDLNSTDQIISKVEPIDNQIKSAINDFIVDSLFLSNPRSNDKYISAVIRGDYGAGKTQTLLYAKYIIDSFKENKDYHKNPYVIYIDNPGAKLAELIGSIIAQIGEENFKRYLWNIYIQDIIADPQSKKAITAFAPSGISLFGTDSNDPFSETNTVNYKRFLDGILKYQSQPKKRREFEDILKIQIITIFSSQFKNATVATYFYEILAENIGINKTWEMLTTGAAKDVERKEVFILKAIVDLVKYQGFTNFYILVDEFETVTEGRLNKAEIDRYFANLRTLIDKERNWCALFAMTGLAFEKLRKISPPLADRIGTMIIDLPPLNSETSNKVLISYLNMAREESDSIIPFTAEAVETLRVLTKGILRLFLKNCFRLVQRAVDDPDLEQITTEFVNSHYQHEEE